MCGALCVVFNLRRVMFVVDCLSSAVCYVLRDVCRVLCVVCWLMCYV